MAISFLLISTAFFSGDSVRYTLIKTQIEPLENLDLILSSNSSMLFDQQLEDVLRDNTLLSGELDAISPRIVANGGISINSRTNLVSSGISIVGMDFTKDQKIGNFKKDGAILDVNSIIPKSSQQLILPVLITDILAYNLQLKEGEKFMVQFYISPDEPPYQLMLQVAAIVDSIGKAVYYSDESIFISLNDLQDKLMLKGKITELALSWNKDRDVLWKDQQEKVIYHLKNVLEGEWSNIKINKVREAWINTINDSTNGITTFYLALGFPSIIAALTLLLIILYLLIEDRKKELATMKALGFKRKEIFFQILSESILLTVIGGIIGIIGGIFTTDLLLSSLRKKPPTDTKFYLISGIRYGYDYVLVVSPKTTVYAFLIGLFVVLVPSIIAAWRISNMNVISALHEHEEVITIKKNNKVGIIVSLISIISIIFGVMQLYESTTDFILFLMIGALGIYIGFSYLVPENEKIHIGWTLLNAVILVLLFQGDLVRKIGASDSIFYYVIGYIYGIIISCILIITILPLLIRGLSWVFSPLKRNAMPIMYAFANLRHHRIRTLLILVILSLVTSMMFSMSSFSSSRDIGIEQAMARNITMNSDFVGYIITPMTNLSDWDARASQFGLTNKLELVSTWFYTSGKVQFAKLSTYAEKVFNEEQFYDITGIDNSVKDKLNMSLIQVKPSYTKTEVWQKVLNGEAALYSYDFYRNLEIPLENITIIGSATNKTVPVLGYIYANNADIFVGKRLFSELYPLLNGTRRLYFNLIHSEDKTNEKLLLELQSNLTKALLPWGPFVRVSYLFIKQLQPLYRTSFESIENYMLLGIIIGIVGISLVVSRKVQRSRFEFGVMISFGASKIELILSLFIEIFFFVISSIVIGYSAPLLFFLKVVTMMTEAPLIIPIFKVTLWAIITLGCAFISSLIPLWQVVNLQPTEVLREMEE